MRFDPGVLAEHFPAGEQPWLLAQDGLDDLQQCSARALPVFYQNFLQSSEIVGSLRRKSQSCARAQGLNSLLIFKPVFFKQLGMFTG